MAAHGMVLPENSSSQRLRHLSLDASEALAAGAFALNDEPLVHRSIANGKYSWESGRQSCSFLEPVLIPGVYEELMEFNDFVPRVPAADRAERGS